MKELQFENFELSGRQSEQNQGASPSSKLLNSSTAISFSAKVVSLLKEKAKWHNKKNPSNKTNISELKEVYRIGARSGEPKGKSALARINMFLRKKSGENVSKNEDPSDKKELNLNESTSTIKSLEFDSEVVDDINLDSLDATNKDYPDEEDFAQADLDIEAYNLDYDFKDVNDLYLDDYEPLGFDGNW